MSFCFCNGTVISAPRTCNGCVDAQSIIIGCGQGITPCGLTGSIDLKAYNSNTPTTVYSVRRYDKDAFETGSVIITNGVLTFDPAEYYRGSMVLPQIEYMAKDGEKVDYGTIQVCFDNPCTVECPDCNWCTGDCYGTGDTTSTTTCGGSGTVDLNAVVDLLACSGVNLFSVLPKSTSINSATVSAGGIVSYTMKSPSTIGTHQIEFDITCSKFGLKTKGVINLIVEDECIGVVLAVNEKCDPCTGDVSVMEADMNGTIRGVGGSAPIGTKFNI